MSGDSVCAVGLEPYSGSGNQLSGICIDARHAKAALKMQINKSDRNDAVGIARILAISATSKRRLVTMSRTPATRISFT